MVNFSLSNLHNSISDVSLGRRHTVVLCSDGSAYGFGSNGFGQLGVLSDRSTIFEPERILIDKRIVLIDCGDQHSAAITGLVLGLLTF